MADIHAIISPGHMPIECHGLTGHSSGRGFFVSSEVPKIEIVFVEVPPSSSVGHRNEVQSLRGRLMDIAKNKEIIQSFYEAGNRGDMEGCMALLADDVTWTNIGSTKYSGSFVGKHDLTAKLLGPVFGRLKAGIESTIDNVIAEGDFVVVQVRGRAETIEGRPYNNTYCHVFKLRGGKIVQVTEYFDTELVSRVLAT